MGNNTTNRAPAVNGPLTPRAREPFVLLSQRMIGDTRLTAVDWRILAAISKRAPHGSDKFRPSAGKLSLSALAKAAATTKATASKRTKLLAEWDYLEITHRFRMGEREESEFALILDAQVLPNSTTPHIDGVVGADNKGVAGGDNTVLSVDATKRVRPSLQTQTPTGSERTRAKRVRHALTKPPPFSEGDFKDASAEGIAPEHVSTVHRNWVNHYWPKGGQTRSHPKPFREWCAMERNPQYKPGLRRQHVAAHASRRAMELVLAPYSAPLEGQWKTK